MLNPFGKDPAKYQGHMGDCVSIGIILEHGFESDLVFWRDLNLPGYAKSVSDGEDIAGSRVNRSNIWDSRSIGSRP